MTEETTTTSWWIALDATRRAIRIYPDKPETVPDDWTLKEVRPQSAAEQRTNAPRWIVVMDVHGHPTQVFTPLGEASVTVPEGLSLFTVAEV